MFPQPLTPQAAAPERDPDEPRKPLSSFLMWAEVCL